MFEKIKDAIEARRQGAVRRELWEEAEEKEAAAQNSQGSSPAKPLARSWEPLTKKTEYPLPKGQQQQAAVPAML